MNESIRSFYIWTGIGENRGWETVDYAMAYFVTLLALLVVGLIIWGIYSLFNSVGSYWHEFSGKLEAKQYEPSTASTSVGFVATGSGGLSPMVSSSGSSESFDIFVRQTDGVIQKLYVDQQRYFDIKIGDTVIFWKKKGRLNGKWIDETTTKPKKINTQ